MPALNALVGRRSLVVGAALLALGVSACGRRGPLEPPPDASVATPAAPAPATRGTPADRRLRPGAARTSATPRTLATEPGAIVEDTPDDENEIEGDTLTSVSPSPTPRKRNRAYTVPKEPFILDPLL